MRIIYYFSIFFLFSCKSSEVLIQNKGFTQGTEYDIKYLSCKGEDYKAQIDSLLDLIDASLSNWDDNSLISRINQGKKMKVDHIFKNVARAAKDVYIASNGYFDCSIGPLINYWGFGADLDNVTDIDSAEVKRILSFVNYSKINIINDSILLQEGMQLDYNAIAQGYSVDLISDFLESNDVVNYLVEIGGELRCAGLNQNQNLWTIGIDKPLEEIDTSDRYSLILSLDNESLATSGDYRKFHVNNGIKYSHIINPKTGFPQKNKLVSVSVIHPSCMLSDAYATAFMIMGVKKTKVYLNSHKELEVFLIYFDDNKEWKYFMTKGFKSKIIN